MSSAVTPKSNASSKGGLFRGFVDIPSVDLKTFEDRKFKLIHVFGRKEFKRRFIHVRRLGEEGSGVLEVYKLSDSGSQGDLSFTIKLPQGKVRKGNKLQSSLDANSMAGTASKRRELAIDLLYPLPPSIRIYSIKGDEVDDIHRSIREVTKKRKTTNTTPSTTASSPPTSPTSPTCPTSPTSPMSSGSFKYGWEIGSAHAMSAEQLAVMRSESDDIGDNCYKALQTLGVGIDTFVDAIAKMADNTGLISAWRRIAAIDMFLKQVYTVPTYVDSAELAAGQLVFLRNSSVAFMALLYFSLIGGFSAPDIVKVLDATAYMTRDEAKTWKRLNETTEFVLDVMDAPGCLDIGGSGWKAALKVRFLHCRVRCMLLKRDLGWDIAARGPPINQEHMMGTLLSFSLNIVEAINRHGKCLTATEEASYLHLWRYIGYLLGVKETNNPLESSASARGAMEAIVLHLLTPDERSAQLAAHVLRSVSDKEPFWWTYRCHCECARRMLGNELADALRIERSAPCSLYLVFVFWLVYLVSCLQSHRLASHSHKGVVRTKIMIRQLVNRAIGKA